MPAEAKQRCKARSRKHGEYFPRTLNSFDEKITALSLITSLYLTKGVAHHFDKADRGTYCDIRDEEHIYIDSRR